RGGDPTSHLETQPEAARHHGAALHRESLVRGDRGDAPHLPRNRQVAIGPCPPGARSRTHPRPRPALPRLIARRSRGTYQPRLAMTSDPRRTALDAEEPLEPE